MGGRIDGYTDRLTVGQMGTWTDRNTHGWVVIYVEGGTNGQTDEQTGKQTDR